MIEKLRKRFICLSLIALSLAMILVTGTINVINWVNVRAELRETLAFYTENEGKISRDKADAWAGRSRHRKNLLTTSTYYMAQVDGEGNVQPFSGAGPGNDAAQFPEEVQEAFAEIAEGTRTQGFAGDYMFSVQRMRGSGRQIVLLDAESSLSRVRYLGVFSALACACGILLAMLVVAFFSRRAIRPFVENEMRQKKFITDASHELKTPLTVISANMDVLSLEVEGNTWVESTQKQVARMRRLVDQMVYLSRLEEGGNAPEMAEMDLTPLVREVAEPFAAMAEFEGKTLVAEVPDTMMATVNAEMLERLVTILCDNAVKYAGGDGRIVLRLGREGKHVVLETENMPSEALDAERVSHLFDRFYRADDARDAKKRGFGIGLSIASAILQNHHGETRAELLQDGRLRISCLFRQT